MLSTKDRKRIEEVAVKAGAITNGGPLVWHSGQTDCHHADSPWTISFGSGFLAANIEEDAYRLAARLLGVRIAECEEKKPEWCRHLSANSGDEDPDWIVCPWCAAPRPPKEKR